MLHRSQILDSCRRTVIGVLLCWASVLWAQTTAINYQGVLTDAGNPATGSYDMQYQLFDTATVGTGIQQGATVVKNPVTMTAGVFNVALDFGANVFDGTDRYLQIGVRPVGSVAAYTILAPRQPIMAAPYAIQTLNAQMLGGLPASGFIQNSGALQAAATFNIGGKGTAGSLDVTGALTQSGSAPPATAPFGQGRIYFDSTTNKVKVSESGQPFVNLVGATGVSGSGLVNTIPLWSAGTTLGSSLISQSGPNLFLPNSVTLAAGAAGNQVEFGTPNAETGLSILGASGRADIRFDGTLKLVASAAGIPPATNGIAITNTGYVGVGTTGPTSKLHVLTADAGVSAIYGESASGRAVWGNSTGASRGVYGQSVSGEGVFGISGSGAGVSGISTTQVGVYGASAFGAGVFGTSNFDVGVSGSSAEGNGVAGVAGTSTGAGGVGVLGTSDVDGARGVLGTSNSPTGVGVYARNLTGIALAVEGNASQNRDKGGLVKLMAYIDQNGAILRCFNGFRFTNSSIGSCGFAVTRPPIGQITDGIYYIDFGIQVDDRFVSVTPRSSSVNIVASFGFVPSAPNLVQVNTNITDVSHGNSFADNAFMIIIY